MKIAFICATLEPGYDGVGDYTHRLAAGGSAAGHECRVFALHDRHVASDLAGQADPHTGAYRWSAQSPWRERLAAIRAEVERFNPDWLSWQFVSYGFQPKGITPSALADLAGSLQDYHSQVMLHETWIGIAQHDRAWARFMGWRQRRALLAFLRALRPAQVQTSNASYAALLARHGWAATVLPLFGNIPVVSVPVESPARVVAHYAPPSDSGRAPLLAVTFGTLHPQWSPEATGRWLRVEAERQGKTATLLAIGRTGGHGPALLERLARTGVRVNVTGELPANTVSCLLQAADCGIALHPRALAGKSGAVAAMLDHGLPVIFPRDEWRLRGGAAPVETADPRLVRLDDLVAGPGATWPGRRPPQESFSHVVAQFLDGLRLKLLFYAPQMAAYGGMERHVCTLAAAAARRGHRVTLLTTSNSLGADLRAELAAPGVELRELPAARRDAGKFAKLRWLAHEVRHARRERWDVIYTNGQGALARVVWLAARGPARRIHHHHTAADAGEQATWSPAFRAVLRQAPEVIACSAATRDALNAAVARSSSLYLPYVTRCPVESAAVRERAAATALNFGFLGRLIPEKGIDAICRLSREPALAGITWHLHGAGPQYPEDYFSSFPGVVYHGAYDGVAAHTRALLGLDAVVLFSIHNEGMPLSLIEAMSAGLPWVATDRGGTRELALSPPDSLVVPHPATDAMLVAAVAEMARRIRAGETSRRAQRQAYDQHFSPTVTGRRWLAFLEARRPVAAGLTP